jgi:hypothetical protein
MIRLDRLLNLSAKEWRRVEYQPSAPRVRIDHDLQSKPHQATAPEWESIYDEHQKGLFQKGVETGSIVRVKRRVPKNSGGGFEVVARLVHTRLIEPDWPAPVAEAPMPVDLPPPARFPHRKQPRPEVELLETAQRYLRLLRMGHDPEEIAASHNTTLHRVDRFLVLATANSDVHQLVYRGSVSVDVAIETVLNHGEGAGSVLSLATKSPQQERRVTGSVLPAITSAPQKTVPAFSPTSAGNGHAASAGIRLVMSPSS